MRSFCRRSNRALAGFTLLEVFATLIVLMLALTALAQFMASIESSWHSAATDPFADASAAFETVTQNLATATLDPYQDYADASGAFHTSASAPFTPDHLARRSDLDFICGPSGGGNGVLAATGRTTATTSVFFVEPTGQTQLYAQAGLDHLDNALGYFVEFGGDTNAPLFFMGAARERWRLKQVVQPSESLQVFNSTASAPWISQMAGSTATPAILAENVIALVVLPERAPTDTGAPIAPAYAYDSRDTGNTLTQAQLPPRLRVALVAIDEASAQKLAVANGTAAPPLVLPTLFQDSTKIDMDLAALDASLGAAKINHRIFQRDFDITTCAWSNTP